MQVCALLLSGISDNELNTYADDLPELTEKLDLKNAMQVGHSNGGGAVATFADAAQSERFAAYQSSG